MKNIAKLLNGLMAFVLGALGFSSLMGCAAYGCPPEPYNALHVSGFVVNENGEPIKNIEVSYAQVNGTENPDTVVIGKIKSKSDGSFDLNLAGFDITGFESGHLVIATDVDGDANGSYETEVKEITMADDSYSRTTYRMTFVMKEKRTTPDVEEDVNPTEE